MTEVEWLTCSSPEPMLDDLRGEASERKLRQFAIACCRRAGDWLDELHHRAFDLRERYEHNRSCEKDLVQVNDRLHDRWSQEFEINRLDWAVLCATYFPDDAQSAVEAASRIMAELVGLEAARPYWPPAENRTEAAIKAYHDATVAAEEAERSAQCDLLREIFHGPRRPVFIRGRWRDQPRVLNLAREIYEDRSFALMPGLGDVLQEAGCDSDQILSHCRSPNDHVRGCWVVNAILMKW